MRNNPSGEDQRKLEMQERLELLKQGNVLHPVNLENTSVILRSNAGGASSGDATTDDA